MKVLSYNNTQNTIPLIAEEIRKFIYGQDPVIENTESSKYEVRLCADNITIYVASNDRAYINNNLNTLNNNIKDICILPIKVKCKSYFTQLIADAVPNVKIIHTTYETIISDYNKFLLSYFIDYGNAVKAEYVGKHMTEIRPDIFSNYNNFQKLHFGRGKINVNKNKYNRYYNPFINIINTNVVANTRDTNYTRMQIPHTDMLNYNDIKKIPVERCYTCGLNAYGEMFVQTNIGRSPKHDVGRIYCQFCAFNAYSINSISTTYHHVLFPLSYLDMMHNICKTASEKKFLSELIKSNGGKTQLKAYEPLLTLDKNCNYNAIMFGENNIIISKDYYYDAMVGIVDLPHSAKNIFVE